MHAVVISSLTRGARLRDEIISAGCQVTMVDDWRAAEATLHREMTDLVVGEIVSPVVVQQRATDIARIRSLFPSITVYLVCDPILPILHRVPELMRAGAYDVLIYGMDNMHNRLREALLHSYLHERTSELFDRLAIQLDHLPNSLAIAVKRLFVPSPRAWLVDDLARAAAMPRRTMDRHLEFSGLASAKTILACSQLFVAYPQLRSQRSQLGYIAAALGHPSVRSFREMILAHTGLRPLEWAALDNGEFIFRFVRAITSRCPVDEFGLPSVQERLVIRDLNAVCI